MEFESLHEVLENKNPNNPIVGKSIKLLSLDNYWISEWWASKENRKVLLFIKI